MNKLFKIIIGAIWIIFPLSSSEEAFAVTIASQEQAFSVPLYAWQVMQELGNNLSGTVSSFTFRISTSLSNISQFDYTAQNTRIYDKDNNNSVISGCIFSPGTETTGPLRGLTFNTNNVPSGFEDVTVDFSCRNFNFIKGHRYFIIVSNANLPHYGGKTIRFAAVSYSNSSNDYFPGGGLRYANGNPWDILHGGGSCYPASYIWNDQTKTPDSGCNIWGTAKDDLYFILANNSPPPPPPKVPVIFIPGIGGSEIRASQDIFWSADDGHGGTYSHAYPANEKIWVNQDEAAKIGDDDYFDILKLKADGTTQEAALSLTGDLTSFGYPDIDPFFTEMGYTKGINFFIFPYDWRKDVRITKNTLDALIETAKTTSGQSKVNLVVHSLGGLIARYYISDAEKAGKVNKLIELGVPHLGAPSALKTLMYGITLQKNIFGIFSLGIPASEIKDISQNSSGLFQLLPSNPYFNFYNNSDKNYPYSFSDNRDVDNNKVTGSLNFDQTKTLLSNLGYNMTVFGLAEQLHNSIDPGYNQTNGTKVYEIVGSNQPTLGQIKETWWITWPVNLIPKTDEIYVNGDDTVPLYSASLKSDSLDISGAVKIYYVDQKHGNLVSGSGTAMQTVKSILNDDSLPIDVKNEKIVLEGEQISLDDGELDLYDDQNRHCGLNDKNEIEENIPDVTCSTSGNTKHAFVKKKATKLKVKTTRKNPAVNSKTTNLKIRTYKQDTISKTVIYRNIAISPTGKIEFTLDPAIDTSPILNFYPDSSGTNTPINFTSETIGTAAIDQTPPATTIQISGTKDSSGIYTGPVTITLNGTDSDSGILRIEYSLDNGQTILTYTNPFTVSATGKTTIQIKSIDQTGNEEIPQSIIIEIAIPPSPSPSPSPSPTPTPISVATNNTSSSNSSGSNTTEDEVKQINLDNQETSLNQISLVPADSYDNNPDILGVEFENPNHISDQINVSKILEDPKNIIPDKNPPEEFLGGLLIVSGSIITIASMLLLTSFSQLSHTSFVKPFPN